MTPSTQNLQPPSRDELEVSLFGPGIGESVVVHIGDGEWIVVDSCVDRRTRIPAALNYLLNIGVDLGKAVRLIVISHWHDDHIQGAAEIVRTASSARVVCSAAVRSEEFAELTALQGRTVMRSSGVSEFRKILAIIEERSPAKSRPGTASAKLAKENERLLYRSGGICPAEVFALSPSDGAIRLSWREIAQNLPTEGEQQRRVVSLSPNQIAVVLWVSVGPTHILLGADLEESPSPTLGWKAIINSTERPQTRAQIFKIPHHGSENADNADVWTKMLLEQPQALLTPFSTRRKFLPTEGDINRLLSRTPHVYCTAEPGGLTPRRRTSSVEKMIKQVVTKRRLLRGPMGHVRVRSSVFGSEQQVDCFEGAYRAQADK